MRTRREVLAATAAALAMPRLAFAQVEPPKPKQLIFNASGGSQIATLRESYLNDFEKETGIKIVDTSPVDFGKLRAMVESGNVSWNITEIGGQDGYRATEMGLAEPIDGKIVDCSKFLPQAQMSHVFSPRCYPLSCYRRMHFLRAGYHGRIWDVKAFPARAGENHPVDNLEAALLADGVALDNSLDVDRAFRKRKDPQAHQCL
jgi:putative spermidine/putrescine transport system substrate-binding protein